MFLLLDASRLMLNPDVRVSWILLLEPPRELHHFVLHSQPFLSIGLTEPIGLHQVADDRITPTGKQSLGWRSRYAGVLSQRGRCHPEQGGSHCRNHFD